MPTLVRCNCISRRRAVPNPMATAGSPWTVEGRGNGIKSLAENVDDEKVNLCPPVPTGALANRGAEAALRGT